MRKILAWVTIAVTAILLGFTIVKLVGGLEVISVSASGDDVITLADKSIYTEVGETFSLVINQENKDNRTEINVEIKHEDGKEVLSYNEETSVVTALNGGVARIIVTTTNKHFATLYLDVFVGDGSTTSPYYIASAVQLSSIGLGDGKYAHYKTDDCYKLVNDIDVSEIYKGYWLPLNEFSGRFDGNGYSIQNLNINRTEFLVNNTDVVANFTNAGLFSVIAPAGRVYNLKFDNLKATGTYVTIGSVAGINYGVIERIDVRSLAFDNIQADYVGGITGVNNSTDSQSSTYIRTIARVDRCAVNLVYGKDNGISGTIGGVVGLNAGGVVIYSYSVGDVTLSNKSVFGGVIGNNSYITLNGTNEVYNSVYESAKVKDTYSAVKVYVFKLNNINNEVIGGVIGINNDIAVTEDNKSVYLNKIVGCYYDEDNLNTNESNILKEFDGIGVDKLENSFVDREEKIFFVYGYNSNKMKVAENFLSHERLEKIYDNNENLIDEDLVTVKWNFEKIWNINSSVNNGYPILRFEKINEIDAIDYSEYDDFSTEVEVKVDLYNLNLSQGIYGLNEKSSNLAKISVYDENDEGLVSFNDSYDLAIFSDAKIYLENDFTLLVFRSNNLIYKIIAESMNESYSIVGWDNGSISELSWIDSPIDCNTDVSLTIWLDEVVKTTKVIFNYNGATTFGVSSQVVEYGKQYGVLPLPTKIGYTFAGWYLENNFINRVDNNTIVSTTAQTHYLYAKWVAVQQPSIPSTQTVTIYLNTNGGHVSQNYIEREIGSVYGILPTPTKEGYNFLGWFTDTSISNKVSSTTTLISKCDHTLYAGWEKVNNTPSDPVVEKTVVYFNSNGGEGSMPSQTFVNGVAQTIICNKFTKAGHKFVGWAREVNGEVLYKDGATIIIHKSNGSVTFYAVWEEDVQETVVYFNSNGGEGSMPSQTFVNGVAQTIICNKFTKTGYKFAGWAREANGEVLYKDGATIIIHKSNGSVTFYAVWEKDIQETVVYFNSNGGEGSMPSQTFVNGVAQTIICNKFTKTGHKFAGWAREVNGEVLYKDGATIIIHKSNGSVTFYAVWEKEPVKEVVVTFCANGGYGTMTNQVFVVGAVQSLKYNNFTKYGYVFMGWSTQPCGSVEYLNGEVIQLFNNLTLYAVWQYEYTPSEPDYPDDPYYPEDDQNQTTTTVYFSANGGDGSMNSQTFVNGVEGNLNTNSYTKDGYVFVGWSTSSSATSPMYTDGTEFEFYGDNNSLVLYAVWQKI